MLILNWRRNIPNSHDSQKQTRGCSPFRRKPQRKPSTHERTGAKGPRRYGQQSQRLRQCGPRRRLCCRKRHQRLPRHAEVATPRRSETWHLQLRHRQRLQRPLRFV